MKLTIAIIVATVIMGIMTTTGDLIMMEPMDPIGTVTIVGDDGVEQKKPIYLIRVERHPVRRKKVFLSPRYIDKCSPMWIEAKDEEIDIFEKSRHGLNVGDFMTYTNENGVVFPNCEILHFARPFEALGSKDVFFESAAWWYPEDPQRFSDARRPGELK